jgi:hypothetical protein
MSLAARNASTSAGEPSSDRLLTTIRRKSRVSCAAIDASVGAMKFTSL